MAQSERGIKKELSRKEPTALHLPVLITLQVAFSGNYQLCFSIA